MKEHPILFSGAMVLALLEGRKTQTRRIVKPQPTRQLIHAQSNEWILDYQKLDDGSVWKCPYGVKGDRLYVRETWAIADNIHGDEIFYYKADNPRPKDIFDVEGFKWKPSIHMPRIVSRIRLDITDIRVERLQDISEEDAIAEGIESRYLGGSYYKNYLRNDDDPEIWNFAIPTDSFRTLWQSIHGIDSWKLNPYCWVVKFKKVESLCQ